MASAALGVRQQGRGTLHRLAPGDQPGERSPTAGDCPRRRSRATVPQTEDAGRAEPGQPSCATTRSGCSPKPPDIPTTNSGGNTRSSSASGQRRGLVRWHHGSHDRATPHRRPACWARSTARGAHAPVDSGSAARGVRAYRRGLWSVARARAGDHGSGEGRRGDPGEASACQSAATWIPWTNGRLVVSQRLRRGRHVARLVRAPVDRARPHHDSLAGARRRVTPRRGPACLVEQRDRGGATGGRAGCDARPADARTGAN